MSGRWSARLQAVGLAYRETNYLALRRGPYVVAAGLDESLADAPHVLRGHFLDLFQAGLPVLGSVTLAPGSRHLLFDLDRARPPGPAVLASACKTLGAEKTSDGAFRFYVEGPDQIAAVLRLSLPAAPTQVSLDGKPLPADATTWDAETKTLLIRFPNAARGHWVTIL